MYSSAITSGTSYSYGTVGQYVVGNADGEPSSLCFSSSVLFFIPIDGTDPTEVVGNVG